MKNNSLTLTEIWTVIGTLGIQPYHDLNRNNWRFKWEDRHGVLVYGEGKTIGDAAEDFVSCFLNR